MQKLLESKVIGRDLDPKLYTRGHVMNNFNTMTRQASDFKVFFQYPYPLLQDKKTISAQHCSGLYLKERWLKFSILQDSLLLVEIIMRLLSTKHDGKENLLRHAKILIMLVAQYSHAEVCSC